MAIDKTIINNSWEGQPKEYVEDGLKVLLAALVSLAEQGVAVNSIGESQLTQALRDIISGKVPNTRMINGKRLNGDVTLKVSDLDNDSGYITMDDLPEGQDLSAYALKSWVQQAINDIIDNAPNALNTLGKLASALANKPSTNEVNTLIQEALSGYTPGETVVASVDDIDIVDNPNGANSDTILAAASARMVKEIYINVKALFQNLAGMAFVGDKPTWQTVPVRTYNIGMASADSNITLTDGNGNSVTSPQPEGTPLTLRLSVANGYRFAAAPTATMGNTNIEFTLDGSYYVATIGALAGNVVITASSVEMGTYSVNIPTGAVFCTSTGAAASSPSIEEGEGVTCYIKPADGRRWATPPSSTGATITLQSGSIYKIVASNVQADITVTGSTEAIPTYAINLPSTGNGIASVALTDANGNAITSPVIEGTAVKIVLTPSANFSINVSTATMESNGVAANLPNPTNVNGVLTYTISSVTGIVVISATAVEFVVHAIRNHFINVASSNQATMVEDGQPYSTVLSLANNAVSDNKDLRVFIGGELMTADTDYTYDSATGALSIPADKITGDIDICMTASTGKITVTVRAGMSTTLKIDRDDWQGFYNDTIDATNSADDVTVVIDNVPTYSYTGIGSLYTVSKWTVGTPAAIKSIDFGGCRTRGYGSISKFTSLAGADTISGLAYVEYPNSGSVRINSYFLDCSNLQGSIDLMPWECTTQTSIKDIINGCSFNEIILPYLPNMISLYGAFAGTSVKRIIFNKTGSIARFGQMFAEASGIEYIDMSLAPVQLVAGSGSDAPWYETFKDSSLSGVTLKIGEFDVSDSPLTGGLSFVDKLICTTATPPNSALLNCLSSSVLIYVPNSAVSNYKTAWSAMANNIHPVSEYTE